MTLAVARPTACHVAPGALLCGFVCHVGRGPFGGAMLLLPDGRGLALYIFVSPSFCGCQWLAGREWVSELREVGVCLGYLGVGRSVGSRSGLLLSHSNMAGGRHTGRFGETAREKFLWTTN